MRVTVFGGTGPTGLLIVRELLASGHEVAAFARDVRQLPAEEPHLTAMLGELSDASAIRSAIQGADATVSALGPHGPSPKLPITAGA